MDAPAHFRMGPLGSIGVARPRPTLRTRGDVARARQSQAGFAGSDHRRARLLLRSESRSALGPRHQRRAWMEAISSVEPQEGLRRPLFQAEATNGTPRGPNCRAASERPRGSNSDCARLRGTSDSKIAKIARGHPTVKAVYDQQFRTHLGVPCAFRPIPTQGHANS